MNEEKDRKTGKRGRPTNAERLEKEGKKEMIKQDLFTKIGRKQATNPEEVKNKKEEEVKGSIRMSEENEKVEQSNNVLVMAMRELSKQFGVMKEEVKEEMRSWKSDLGKWKDEWGKRIESMEERIKRLEKKLVEKNEERGEEQIIEQRLAEIEQNVLGRIDEKRKGPEKEEIEKIKKTLVAREKRERRNNIIIRGIRFDGEGKSRQVEDFIEKELNVKVRIEWAAKLGGENSTTTVAKVQSWEGKREVMKLKNRLGDRKVYIDNDLTWEEREVQKSLRERARVERERGRRVKIGYRKICIEDKWINWENLEERREMGPRGEVFHQARRS